MIVKELLLDPKTRKYLPQIIKILRKSFSGHNAKVYLFGSRARDETHYASDFDLAIDSDVLKEIDLINLKEAFHESTIPYKVDVVSLREISEGLKSEIEHEGILIWEN